MTAQNERNLKKELIKSLEGLCKEPIYRDHITSYIQQLQDKNVIIPNSDFENLNNFLLVLENFLQKLRMEAQVKAQRGRGR